MKKHNNHQSGFTLTLVCIAIVLIGAVGAAGYMTLKNKDSSTVENTEPTTETTSQSDTKQTPAEEPIKLYNIGLESIDDIVIDQYATRDFMTSSMKGFYIFGDSLPGNRLNPNFEYSSVRADAKVVSAIEGVVTHINQQNENGQSDYEVFVQPKEGSKWMIGYDHLINVAVSEGDKVKVGSILGNPGVQNNGLSRFEIQINDETAGLHYCPTELLHESVRDKISAYLTSMMQSWESKTGLELYDTNAQSPVGCTKTTLTPAAAEGR